MAAAFAWLRNQGYRLEHVTGNAFGSKKLFKVRRGLTYQATDAVREVDVLALALLMPETPAIYLVIECKGSSKPWIVLTDDLAKEEFSWTPITMPPTYGEWLAKNRPILQKALPIERPIGYSLVAAHSDPGESNAGFKALSQVVDAAMGLNADVDRFPSPHLIIPVLVVDMPIYTLTFDESGDEILTQVTWSRIVWGGSQRLGHPILIEIIHESDLAARAMALRLGCGVLLGASSPWE